MQKCVFFLIIKTIDFSCQICGVTANVHFMSLNLVILAAHVLCPNPDLSLKATCMYCKQHAREKVIYVKWAANTVNSRRVAAMHEGVRPQLKIALVAMLTFC